MATTDPLSIPSSTVDFQQILELFLQRILKYNAWKDVYESNTGTTLAELVAAATVFLNTGMPVAQRETYLLTARRDSSIYGLAATMGTRISRKVSAGAQVVLTRQGSIVEPLQIPEYTAFSIGGKAYFNREPIIFPANVAQITQLSNVRLYEGTLNVRTNFNLDELPGFRRIAIGVQGFTVADSDIRVKVNGKWWTRSTQPIWFNGPGDTIFNDATNGYGDAELVFGDGFTGSYLANTDELEVHYITTTGSLGNGVNPPTDVSCATLSNVKGVTVTPSVGGADEKDAEYYRITAPHLFRGQGKAVTPEDHIAIALDYPLTSDMKLQAQRDFAPYDIRWMNTIRMILLPREGDSFSALEKQAFLAYFRQCSWANLVIDLSVDPIPVIVNIVLNVYIFKTANAQTVKAELVKNIQKLFERKPGVLGRQLTSFDLSKVLVADGIDTVSVVSPTTDVLMPNAWSFAKLGNLVVNIQQTTRGN